MEYRIRALDNEVETAGFRCDEAAPDEYLHRYAKQDIKRGVARVFVATPADRSESARRASNSGGPGASAYRVALSEPGIRTVLVERWTSRRK